MHHTEFIDQLREKGHRLTPQREMILSVICESACHLTADQILKRVRKHYPYINKSAVYRTLELLTRLGFVNPIDFGQGRVEYQVHLHPHHHHLLCRNCHQMIQVDERVFSPLKRSLRKEYGFVPDLDHLAIFGLCHKCDQPGRKPTR